jgi:MSHA biogenesis protein MshO
MPPRSPAEQQPRRALITASRFPIPDSRPSSQHGFTMIELVMVIVLTGILASITAVFIVEPMRAYVDQSRRTALVDDAEIALRQMGREIRSAVPNSVLVPNPQTLTFYNAVSGGRYRASPPGDTLDFDNPAGDGSFDLLGGFPGIADGTSLDNHFLVIYNLGTAGSNLYEGSGAARPVITPTMTISINAGNVTLGSPFQFGWESPEQRVYLSDGQVSYACAGGQLTRNGVTVTSGATCNFSYSAGTATRSALATLNLTLSRDGETVTLLRQVHVENLP